MIDTGRDQQSRFTFDASLETLPLWSPDGSRVVFASVRALFPNAASVIFEKPASGAGDEQPLPVTGEPKTPLAWSSDGQFLLYGIQHPKTGADLWALPLAGDRTPLPVLQTPFDETSGQFSPDGRWVAYQSNDSGPIQIYVRPFRGPGGPWQVSTAGGSQPRWRPDGKELFYVAADARLMAVPIAVGVDPQTLKAGAPVPLFRTRLASGASIDARCEAAVCGRLRRALSDERVRRGSDAATYHGRPQLGRGVEEVTRMGHRPGATAVRSINIGTDGPDLRLVKTLEDAAGGVAIRPHKDVARQGRVVGDMQHDGRFTVAGRGDRLVVGACRNPLFLRAQ